MKLIAVSYAWIEIFLGTEKGQRCSRAINESDQTLTPEVVLAEISRKYFGEGSKELEIQRRMRTISQSSELIGIDEAIALESGKAYLEILDRSKVNSGRSNESKKPSLFDAIILATARINKAKVLTGDLYFKGLPETIWIE